MFLRPCPHKHSYLLNRRFFYAVWLFVLMQTHCWSLKFQAVWSFLETLVFFRFFFESPGIWRITLDTIFSNKEKNSRPDTLPGWLLETLLRTVFFYSGLVLLIQSILSLVMLIWITNTFYTESTWSTHITSCPVTTCYFIFNPVYYWLPFPSLYHPQEPENNTKNTILSTPSPPSHPASSISMATTSSRFTTMLSLVFTGNEMTHWSTFFTLSCGSSPDISVWALAIRLSWSEMRLGGDERWTLSW